LFLDRSTSRVQFEETYSDLLVLDLSENIAGPLACLIFADMGADVVKVERSGLGDATRNLPPYWGDVATVFQTVNRNKRSVVLDLKAPAGRAALLKLAARADVVVESFRPGVAERLGIGYDDLSSVNDRLIHLSVNAFGTGELGHDRPGYDALVQAFTGIMEMTGEAGGGPVRAAPSLLDISTGLWGALAIQAALARRDRSAGPQRLEATLIDSGLFMLCHQVIGYLGTGQFPGRLGSAAPSAAPYQVFSTSDQPIMIATSTDRMFQTLCGALSVPHLATDPRFVDMAGRLERRDELASALQEVLVTAGSSYWLDTLADAGIPASPVNDLAAALDHPVTKERGLIAPAAAGDVAELLQIHLPMDRERTAPRAQAPRLGQHTEAVLREAGLTDDEISDAMATGEPRGTGRP
jgi:crotonobetainyl-CoA:carnitine CoA-transferase CaiB-like acyl-CoA transferase